MRRPLLTILSLDCALACILWVCKPQLTFLSPLSIHKPCSCGLAILSQTYDARIELPPLPGNPLVPLSYPRALPSACTAHVGANLPVPHVPPSCPHPMRPA